MIRTPENSPSSIDKRSSLLLKVRRALTQRFIAPPEKEAPLDIEQTKCTFHIIGDEASGDWRAEQYTLQEPMDRGLVKPDVSQYKDGDLTLISQPDPDSNVEYHTLIVDWLDERDVNNSKVMREYRICNTQLGEDGRINRITASKTEVFPDAAFCKMGNIGAENHLPTVSLPEGSVITRLNLVPHNKEAADEIAQIATADQIDKLAVILSELGIISHNSAGQ